MKKIGIIGGITPDSTARYYEELTSWNRDGSKGDRFPTILIYSLDLLNWYRLLAEDDEDSIVQCLLTAANSLRLAGADFAIIAANTPHMYFETLEKKSPLPLLSIVEATAEAASSKGYKRVGLLGTIFTMRKGFYPAVFSKYGIEIVVPALKDQEYINKVLFEEVAKGKYLQSSKEGIVRISKKLEREEKIEALILGCTELPLFIDESDVGMPVLDTVAIHVRASLRLALNSNSAEMGV